MKKVLEGEHAARFGYDLAAAAMAGKPLPKVDYEYITAEGIRIGSGRYFKELTEHLTRLPAKLSDDPATQKLMLEEIQQRLAEAEVLIADAMFKLTAPDPEG